MMLLTGLSLITLKKGMSRMINSIKQHILEDHGHLVIETPERSIWARAEYSNRDGTTSELWENLTSYELPRLMEWLGY